MIKLSSSPRQTTAITLWYDPFETSDQKINKEIRLHKSLKTIWRTLGVNLCEIANGGFLEEEWHDLSYTKNMAQYYVENGMKWPRIEIDQIETIAKIWIKDDSGLE